MRDAKHFRKMMIGNPGASVGSSLAAAAVYAATYGVCEAEQHATPEYKAIARDLQARYGENLDAGDVLREMADAAIDAAQLAGPNVATVTLTTARAESSYGRPVLVLDDGAAYGPGDMTPAGITGAELVRQWAARYTGANK